jgi:Concanavalin A-like lectin/glucanases superfamily
VVLTRGGVLGLVLGLVSLGGCSDSLFGARHGGPGDDGGGPDGGIPGTCTGSCIADAAANFNGTAHGAGNHWSYLEDRRGTWQWDPMSGDINEMTGSDPDNHITTCAAKPDAPACKALPGALLVSSSGTGGAADAAIQFASQGAQVLQLSLHAFVPSGEDQTIRLYRNSREDVLFTGTAKAGTHLDQVITLDSLPSDRFLVAVVPPKTSPAVDVGLDLTVSTTDRSFPSSCQLSLRFESRTGNSTTDLVCRNSVFTHLGSTGAQTPLMLGAGPYVEQGFGAQIPGGTYLKNLVPTDVIDHTQDVTIQFWVRLNGFVGLNAAFPFSDMDLDVGGGIGVSIWPGAGSDPPTIDVQTCTDPVGPKITHATGMFPVPGAWQFVRVVHTSTGVQVCVNGAPAASSNAATTQLKTMYPPGLGKDAFAQPSQAYFDGSLDDLRVITGALPCE